MAIGLGHLHGPSSPPSPSASASPPSALQSAIAFLRRGLRADGSYDGVDEWDFLEHQWNLLHEWAKGSGLILPTEVSPTRIGGQEHDVCYVPAVRRWLKFTKPSRAGVAVELVGDRLQMFPASPLQYLRRWRLANRVLGDDVELLGLSREGSRLRLVISQRDLVGESPGWEAIHRAMTEVYDLRQVEADALLGGYESRVYANSRYIIFDVRPANCVLTADGEVVLFDVIPQVLARQMVPVLRTLG